MAIARCPQHELTSHGYVRHPHVRRVCRRRRCPAMDRSLVRSQGRNELLACLERLTLAEECCHSGAQEEHDRWRPWSVQDGGYGPFVPLFIHSSIAALPVSYD